MRAFTKANVCVNLLVLVLLVTALTVGSCRESIPSEYRSFFDRPLGEQSDALQKYPLNKQIDIYLIAVTRIHPPLSHLAVDLARHEKKVVPYLVERLREEEDDELRADIIYVFRWMARLHNYGPDHPFYIDYDVRNDLDVVSFLEQVVSLNGLQREDAEESLRVIRGK